ncbi:hypothetical protein PGT21_021468 [Puccinia graminis f. sp. tritici]|uniref:Uncharacterized protein n=1 Tax=Puccinia graminis f. sp. tritici TaxID=56615 RepID=A0A5B0PGH4_PUCGR|nr:hypothetical protein PGT21_021468 [Puccinia graminis f. sp. tritici]
MLACKHPRKECPPPLGINLECEATYSSVDKEVIRKLHLQVSSLNSPPNLKPSLNPPRATQTFRISFHSQFEHASCNYWYWFIEPIN